MQRAALAAAAAGLLLSGWAGVLDPDAASADAPWWPGEPPATPCDDEGLTPGTQCVESWRHVRRSHTYVFDAGIWGNMGNLVCHQPPYIDPIGPGTGGVFDSYGILIATVPAEFQKTALIEAQNHTVPAAPASVQDWEVIENENFYTDDCALTMENFYTVESYSASPLSPHEFRLGVAPEPGCDDHRLLSLRGRASSSSASLTPAFDPDHSGYHLALTADDTSGWLAAVPRGCAELIWLDAADGSLGSWRIFNVAHGDDRDVALLTRGDNGVSVYVVIMSRADCDTGEHRHGTVGCHDHPRPPCTESGLYEIMSGSGHIVGFTAVCVDPVCDAGEHGHGMLGCHSHDRPVCTSTGAYTIIVGNGHGTGTTDVCDDPGPTDCSDHQHVDSPGSPGVDANGDGDFDDDGDTAPVPATYLDHAHCQPLCTWPVGAHYLIHDGEGGHDDAYELCPPATSPAVACVVDGVAGLGDAVKVSWTDGSTSSFDLQWRWMRGSQAFGTTQRATSSSSESQISFDTAALDSAFGAAQRGVQVRVSALRYAWSPWATIQCGVSCAAALNRLAGRTHLVAGNVDRAEPYLGAAAHNGGVPLTQVVWPSRRQTIYLIDAGNGTRIEDHPGVAECGGHRVGEWDWDFSSLFTAWTTFTAGHTVAAEGCTSGGSYCVYRVIDPAAVDQIFTLQARPVARTKLTGRPVAGTPSTASVLTRAAWIP